MASATASPLASLTASRISPIQETHGAVFQSQKVFCGCVHQKSMASHIQQPKTEKLTSSRLLTMPTSPTGHSQYSRQSTPYRIIVATREYFFLQHQHFKCLPPFPPKLTSEVLYSQGRGNKEPRFPSCGCWTRNLWLTTSDKGVYSIGRAQREP